MRGWRWFRWWPHLEHILNEWTLGDSLEYLQWFPNLECKRCIGTCCNAVIPSMTAWQNPRTNLPRMLSVESQHFEYKYNTLTAINVDDMLLTTSLPGYNHWNTTVSFKSSMSLGSGALLGMCTWPPSLQGISLGRNGVVQPSIFTLQSAKLFGSETNNQLNTWIPPTGQARAMLCLPPQIASLSIDKTQLWIRGVSIYRVRGAKNLSMSRFEKSRVWVLGRIRIASPTIREKDKSA